MRTITINLYQFEELDGLGQKRALQQFADVNTCCFDWWETVYEYAKEFDIVINGFDIDNRDIKLFFTSEKSNTVYLINAGDNAELKKLVAESGGNIVPALRRYWLTQLTQEYEYLTSDNSIAETIKSNGYDFLKDGTFWTHKESDL